ncbi:MAG: mechanosensitive ion channel domain-containing protein, partial [Cyanobacteria bacterium J06560_2]
NPYTLTYLLGLIGLQGLYRQWRQSKRNRIITQRLTRGLPSGHFSSHLRSRPERLSQRRRNAMVETAVFIFTLLIVPMILIGIARLVATEDHSTLLEQNGIAIVLLSLLLLTLIGGRQAAQAFVGGLTYKVMSTFTLPFQPGDYITVKGVSGRVTQLNTFFTKVKTHSGQNVSLPTYSLWNEAIATCQKKGQICEVTFYLSPAITSAQSIVAESTLRDTVHSSAYIEPSGPVNIYYTQRPNAIELKATATVTAAEHSAAFSSEVTQQFLAFTRQKQIPLAHVASGVCAQ